ncbi:hypothetical protein BDV93DRAFT_164220 [Ceratobasidium sp. AG-I]|nr:hypothetical protein BDV93DRAFT_164220 [Ceratobasidium sp. AG-I]
MGTQQSTVSRRPRDKALPALPRLPPIADFPPPGRCTICLEYGVVFPKNTPTFGCNHPIEFCVPCMETYVCVGIKNGINVKCPTMGCPSEMDVNEIQSSIGGGHKAEFEKFCERKVRYQLQNEAALVWCRAPGCGSGQIHVGGDACPIVTCQQCSARMCFTHDCIWHEGKTCTQYTAELKKAPDQRSAESKQSEDWISGNTKTCPRRACRRPIEKQSGCDHMTCRKPGGCGHEFCWACLAPYGPIRYLGNRMHKRSCIHHT